MLKLEKISKSYKGNKVINELSYDFQAERIYSILGKSGVGKSTLGKILCQLEKEDEGAVYLQGQILNTISRQVAMVFQDSFSSMNRKWTVSQIIREPIRNYLALSRSEEEVLINRLLEEVSLTKEDGLKKPHQLSGGQQKRVAIARAIAYKPQLIVFDEAISGFDIQVKKDILDMLIQLRIKYGLTYIFISHDEEVARYVSDTVLLLNNNMLKEI